MRKYFVALALLLLPFAAFAQQGGSFYVGPYSYGNVTAATTLTLKSGAGFLHTVCINTPAAGTLGIFDNTAASGVSIGVLTEVAAQAPGCSTFDVQFSTGLTLQQGAAGNVTASYR